MMKPLDKIIVLHVPLLEDGEDDDSDEVRIDKGNHDYVWVFEDVYSCLQLSLSAIDKKVTTKRTSTYLSKELYTSMVERAMAKADHIVAFYKNVGVNVLVDVIPSFIQEAERWLYII